jgi:hypothetical protein
MPTIWLDNLTYSDTIFKCGLDYSRLEWGLAWGKPVIKRDANLNGIVLHNVQLDANLYRAGSHTKLVLQHLKELIPEQRIAANREKLIKRNFVSIEDTVDEILCRELTGVSDTNIIMYIDEIRRLRAAKPPSALSLGKGMMQFLAGGEITYFSNEERMAVSSFISDCHFVQKVLIDRSA